GNTWTSWLTLGFFGTYDSKPALGRNVPEHCSDKFSKILATTEGKKFIQTTPEELQITRSNLRKIPPKAPIPPVNPYCGKVHTNPLFNELLLKVKAIPSHEEKVVPRSWFILF